MPALVEETVPSEVAELGNRIRDLRGRHGWTLDDLARRTDLSKSYLSRLEDGGRQPSIAALLALAQAFGVSLAALFAPEQAAGACTVVRADSLPEREGDGLRYTSLAGGGTSAMQPIRMTVFADRMGDELYRHDGEEWLYVLQGTLRLILAGETYDLNPGDAAQFDARLPHRLAALGERDAELILVACAAPNLLLHRYL